VAEVPAGAPPIVAPLPAVPPPTTPPLNPQAELTKLASRSGASRVTGTVQKKPGLFAVMVVQGRASLLRWTGSAWTEDRVLPTPDNVTNVFLRDVTGDGTSDFVVQMDSNQAMRMFGGVYNYGATGWDWQPFLEDDGPTNFVDGLHLEGASLRSSVYLPRGGRGSAQWTWDSTQFAPTYL
jgi:hypothetical protein